MNASLHPGSAWLAFGLASTALAATPGPGVVYIVTRTIAQGRHAGLASVAGVALGNLGNALGASLGLAALFAVSSLAFTVVKVSGAAYLVVLGIQALRATDAAPSAALLPAPHFGRIFRDGLLVALLNPKTAIFFAAFLPQFIDADASPIVQSALFGAVFVLIAATTDSAYVLAAHRVAPRLARRRGGGPIGRLTTAAIYLGLGIYTAASIRHA